MRLGALALIVSAVAAGAPAGATAASWEAPRALTPRDGAAYAAPQAAASGGRALAAWVRAPAGTAGRARTWIATRERRGGRWTRPRALSGPGTGAPRVAVNARGDAVVAWTRGRRLVAASRRGPDGRWSAAPVADTAAGVQDARVAVDLAGHPTVLWTEPDGDGFTVRLAARRSPRRGWEIREARVSTAGPEPPALALSRSGALVAWNAGGATIVSRTSRGTFEAARRVAEDPGAPGVALSGRGAALAAWSTVLPGGSPVMVAAGRAARATGWSVPVDLGIGLRPRVALSDRGDAVVAWRLSQVGAAQGVEAAVRSGGRGRWRASTVVPRVECRCSLVAGGAAVGGPGQMIVSWRRDTGEETDGGGAAALEPGDVRWARARVAGDRLRAAPSVAGDPSGGGLAVWAETGPRGGVRAAELRP